MHTTAPRTAEPCTRLLLAEVYKGIKQAAFLGGGTVNSKKEGIQPGQRAWKLPTNTGEPYPGFPPSFYCSGTSTLLLVSRKVRDGAQSSSNQIPLPPPSTPMELAKRNPDQCDVP